jgi:hypothetical protein
MNPYINKEKKIKKSYEIIPFSKSVFFFLHSSTIKKKKKTWFDKSHVTSTTR